ncbi:hypothetical protein KUTeg_010877 [Tegillarca granosa]|uniref:Integrase catalytic domain-containing protein n=1 Tax=Tegillarca granosa TaxID=220873 RepID=A0ABQ9F5G2_TEGGR|nr:hypothetical protein KUTeg_010877 [Tegillarca granosa]
MVPNSIFNATSNKALSCESVPVDINAFLCFLSAWYNNVKYAVFPLSVVLIMIKCRIHSSFCIAKRTAAYLIMSLESFDYFYTTNSEIKSNYAERANLTVKSILYRYFQAKQSYAYLKDLQSLIESYNHKPHRSLNYMSPSEVNKTNQAQLWKYQYRRKAPISKVGKSRKTYKFKLGDTVRISYLKYQFQRAYDQQWTDEIFRVSKRFRRDGIERRTAVVLLKIICKLIKKEENSCCFSENYFKKEENSCCSSENYMRTAVVLYKINIHYFNNIIICTMSYQIRQHASFLNLLYLGNPQQRKGILNYISDGQMFAIVQVAHKVLTGEIPISASYKKKLRRYKRNDCYILIDSEDSRAYFPQNTVAAFRVVLDTRLDFKGQWYVGLCEVHCTNVTSSGEIYICTNICGETLLAGKKEQLLRRIVVEKDKDISTVFTAPFYLPLTTSTWQDIEIYIKDKQGHLSTLIGGKVSLTLHIRRYPFFI